MEKNIGACFGFFKTILTALLLFMALVNSQNIRSRFFRCELFCPVYIREQYICSSNGKLYVDECRAKCDDRNNFQLFTCEFNKKNECAKKCKESLVTNKCENKCPVYIREQYICASDGNIYMDECRAQCADKNNFELFNCEDLDPKKCQEKCNESVEQKKCEDKCPIYIRQQLVCGSDGNLYIDDCRAKCKDPKIEILFDCGYPVNEKECSEKCQNEIDDSENVCPHCENEPYKPVCGLDGVIYDGKCLAGCIAGDLFYELNTAVDENAKTLCTNYYEASLCQKTCSRQDNESVCASDGYVYANRCVARCADLSVINYCEVDVRKCFEECIANN